MYECTGCGVREAGTTANRICPGRPSHAEKLQAATLKVDRTGMRLADRLDNGGDVDAITALIDAKIELALLERDA